MKTGRWAQRITLGVARVLARKTASTWIMIGTLGIAGFGATALNAAPAAHSQPVRSTSTATATVPSTSYPYCYFGYASDEPVACSHPWGYYGWHRHHWAEYLWRHYSQTGQQVQTQSTVNYAGSYGYHGMYAGMSGYQGAYDDNGIYGYRHDNTAWGSDTWTTTTPSTVSVVAP